MCLLEALLDISCDCGFSVGAAHFNHRLRGEESDRDEGFVRSYCEARDVPFYSGSGDVSAYAAENKLGLELAAREMRYGFFCETAIENGALRLATAHTVDDNAETVLLNLMRGTGANGLSGIPPVRDITAGKNDVMIIRPMLHVCRREVMAFLVGRGIPFVEDSTNNMDIFTRNRIRHNVIPVLSGINLGLNEAISALTEISGADERYLSQLAEEFIREHCDVRPVEEGRNGAACSGGPGAKRRRAESSANAADILGLPLAVSRRVIRDLCGGSLSFRHTEAILELCKNGNPSASLDIPGMTVRREYDRLVFGPAREPAADVLPTVCPSDGDTAYFPGLGLKMSCKSVICNDKINKPFTFFLFKSVDICGKMTVRPRREGDFIRLSGGNGSRTLKKLFIDRRIPAWKRDLIPVIADDKGVLAVYGIGMGDRAVPEPGDPAIRIDFE